MTLKLGHLIMLVGLPASGKSTVSEIFRDSSVIVSSDEIRKELLGDINDQSKNNEVFEEVHKRIQSALNEGLTVVYDATNINRKRRIHTIKNVLKASSYSALYVHSTLENAIHHDKIRDRVVGEDVIKGMYRNLHIPTIGEGWDVVGSVISDYERCEDKWFTEDNLEGDYETLMYNLQAVIPEFKPIYKLPHDSSYHKYDVSEHIYNVYKYIKDEYSGEHKLELMIAALFHDVGKGFTKSFISQKGEEREYASYIGHENVSAQIAFEVLSRMNYDNKTINMVVDLVQFHMKFHDMSFKTERNMRKLVSDEVYEMLLFLNKADLQAH